MVPPINSKSKSPDKQLLSSFPPLLSRCAKSGWTYCLLMILILFAVRNVMLLSDLWAAYDQGDFPESMTAGNFAYDILDGVWRGWNCYLGRTIGHTGWAVISSFVAIPLYFVFGPYLLTLCQVPILFSAAIICLIYWLCVKYFDRTTAFIAVAFYVFMPRHIQAWALYPYCDLLEHSFFSLLGLSFFLKAYDTYHQNPQNKKWWMPLVVLFGLSSGIGIFHSEVYLFMLGAIFITCLFHNARFLFRKSFIILFLLAFLIGLIPYLLASPMISTELITEWFTAKFALNGQYQQPGYYNEAFLGAIASLFWPIQLLSFGFLKGAPLLLVGSAIGLNPQRKFKFIRPQKTSTFVLNTLRVCAFSYIFITVSSGSDLIFQSYVFPVLPYMCILFAIVAADMIHFVRNTKIYMLRAPIFLIVVFCCGYNCFQILKDISPGIWKRELKKLVAIKGCNFYWPSGYYPPQGYKTPVTKMVEEIGGLRFSDELSPNRKSVVLEGVSYPVKKICANYKTNHFPFRPLDHEGYFVYGIDVTFAGLETLAEEIQSRGFSAQDREKAFVSLAVYYNSDHWMSFLLRAYKNKDVAKVVPKPYRKYFYQEFGRRLRSQYGDNLEKINPLIAEFTAEQVKNITAAFQAANLYVPVKPFNRHGFKGAYKWFLPKLKSPLLHQIDHYENQTLNW